MSATSTKTPTPTGLPAATFNRILDEGYGPGAWYGSDLRAALAEVTAGGGVQAAGRRPSQHRRSRAAPRLLGRADREQADRRGRLRRFRSTGEDWFELDDESRLSWTAITSLVDAAHQRLSRAVGEIASGARISPLREAERFDFVIGITGHAAYHAGQIQLIKKLI